MPFTFPYPQLGSVTRPIGQGCTGCVHSPMCPAVYWFRRYTFKDIEPAMGRACTSWSPNPAARVTTWNQTDLNEEDYMTVQGITSEANRCGIGGETLGGSRESEGV